MQKIFKADGRAQLFALGFLTLFLELVFIRFMSGNIWNLGYFPNLVLISVFIGLGTGFISHRLFSEKTSDRLFCLASPAAALLVFLIYLIAPEVPGFDKTGANFGDEHFFSGAKSGPGGANAFLFPVWFIFIAAVFFLIAQRTAKLFLKLRPLTAYSFDILGSCFGVAAFICVSFLEVRAGVWFLLCIPLFLASGPFHSSAARKKLAATALAVPMLAASLAVFYEDREHGDRLTASEWSPYQKVDISTDGRVFVNNIEHQSIKRFAENEYLYSLVHKVRKAKRRAPYERVLIIGSGTGNDVKTALLYGAKEVDAVEIDPAIARMGRFDINNPYLSPKTELIIDDGRHFMTATDRKYDLVVFALTDSLVKLSSLSQIRLESYLFTQESINRAWSLVSEGGTLLAVNFHRNKWIPLKIGRMMNKASGNVPVLYFSNEEHVRRQQFLFSQEFFVITDKAPAHSYCAELNDWRMDCADLNAFETLVSETDKIELPGDDWPFLYIKNKSIQKPYIYAMLFILFFAGAMLVLLKAASRRFPEGGGTATLPSPSVSAAFMLMGTAFLLLETKSVIQFSLIFGNTWLNSSLVFLAVLVLILAANWVAEIIKSEKLVPVSFFLLLVSCLSVLLFPVHGLLEVDNTAVRFVLASFMTLSPIFFANIVFSSIFRKRKSHEVYFGWNLVGAVLGGALEYTSVLVGYQSLAFIVLALYAGVFVIYRLRIAPYPPPSN